jgi:hypothetical protein
LAHCKRLRRPRALYDNIEALPAFREWARTHGLQLYRRWGFWHDDVTLKLVSVHPLARILKVPELRARALCGPSIEAAFIAHAMVRITNARSLSRDIGVSYAAAHAAVEPLVGRGPLLRHRNGVRQELSPSAFAVQSQSPFGHRSAHLMNCKSSKACSLEHSSDHFFVGLFRLKIFFAAGSNKLGCSG